LISPLSTCGNTELLKTPDDVETEERFGGLQIYCEVELDLVSRSIEEQDEQEFGPSSGGRSSKLSGSPSHSERVRQSALAEVPAPCIEFLGAAGSDGTVDLPHNGDATGLRAPHLDPVHGVVGVPFMRGIGRTFAQIARLSLPYFRSEDRWAGRGLLGA